MAIGEQRAWERTLRELYRRFSSLEQELRLLREIDQSILDINSPNRSSTLEHLFLSGIDEFSRIHRTEQPMLCYVSLGSQLALLQDDGASRLVQRSSYPVHIPLPIGVNPIRSETDTQPPRISIIAREDNHQIFRDFPDASTVILYPLYSHSGLLLCLFLLADRHRPDTSAVSEPDFIESVRALGSQLAIAYNHRNQLQQYAHINTLWTTFLNWNLSPTKCFKELATWIPSTLPDFGPLKFMGHAQVQVLMLADTTDFSRPEHLVIRGTTGDEPENTRVAIPASICGLLLTTTMSERPYFCDDPTKPEYIGKYKNYLGKSRDIRTELAVRLRTGEHTIGVLNLEADVVDAFNVHHVDAISDTAHRIAPIVAVLEKRLQMNSLMQMSVTASMSKYLEGLGKVFRHSVNTPLATLRSNLELIQGETNRASAVADVLASAAPKDVAEKAAAVSAGLQSTAGAFARLTASSIHLRDYTNDFVEDIAGYGTAEGMHLKRIVEGAVHLVTNSLLAKSGNRIRLEVHDNMPSSAKAFCSTLLKQHLYSLLHNAVLSIEERLESDPAQGVVLISLVEHTPPPSEEVALNTTWALSIRDNGKGVTAEELEELRKFQPGVRFRPGGGQGHGLVAAQRYVSSLGGRVDLDAVLGDYFLVTLHFQPIAKMGRKDTES